MTDRVEVRAPRVNANDETVLITKWLVERGAGVEIGTPVVEIETSKAIVELEAEARGYISPVVPVGAEVAVGVVIAWVYGQAVPAEPEAQPDLSVSADAARLISQQARALMREHGIVEAELSGSGPVRRADIERALQRRGVAEAATEPIWEEALATVAGGEETVLVYGADLQGTVVVDCLQAQASDARVVLVDDKPASVSLLGFPVFSPRCLGALREKRIRRAHVAISGVTGKLARVAKLKDLGFEIIQVRHPSASVARSARVGIGAFLGPLTLIGPEAEIGDYAQINNAASVAHHSRVGVCARLSDGVRLAGRVVVGDRSFLGLGVTVNERITIGADTTIVSGVSVFRDIPANSLVRTDGKAYPNRSR